VYCQLVYLRGCHPGRIRHALTELPETLDETYERTLRDVKSVDSELAHRLFQCVAVACRPLRVEELAEFLALKFDVGQIPTLHEGWRLEDPIDAVLSTCSTLLSLVIVDDYTTIQFSHFSVMEYLTSSRFANKRDPISLRYHISMTPAHTLVAQACLCILLNLDDNITQVSLQKFPLAEYAAEFWVNHALFEGVSQSAEEAMMQLFDTSKSHLAAWLWIYDPYRPERQHERLERPSPPLGTPLHYAAFYGLQPIMKALAIEHAQDVNSRRFHNDATPLHLASRNGFVEKFLNQWRQVAGTRVSEKQWLTPLRQTPLHQASQSGSLEVARLLIDHGADLEVQDKHGNTPLHEASMSESVEIARLLLELGAATTAQNERGLTPLHLASRSGNVDIARLLIEHRADVAVKDERGSTPLHDASAFGSLDVACLLVEHGAATTSQDNDGVTPLHQVSRLGIVDIGRLLIEHGADLAAQSNFGSTPLRDALFTGSMEIARLLVEKGADLGAQDEHGNTMLHDMSFFGTVEQASLLIELGAPTSAQNKYGSTPLHMVSKSGNVDVARLLVENGADVAAQDRRGNTPLHDASFSGSLEVARLLIEFGAVTTAENNIGSTPLHEASLLGNADIKYLLIEHGADPKVLDEHKFTLPWDLEASGLGGVDLGSSSVEHRDSEESDEDDFYSLSDVSSF
jgi:ankyrin repeat protein